MIYHWKVNIRGSVQGVWYRKYAQQRALELGLKGFVQNQPDGSVYSEWEGELPALEAMKSWCWQGSPLSHVEEVATVSGSVVNFRDFEVRK